MRSVGCPAGLLRQPIDTGASQKMQKTPRSPFREEKDEGLSASCGSRAGPRRMDLPHCGVLALVNRTLSQSGRGLFAYTTP